MRVSNANSIPSFRDSHGSVQNGEKVPTGDRLILVKNPAYVVGRASPM